MITVMVTAIGGGGHGEQILKALRLANGGRYRIVGCDANLYCPQFGLVEEPVVVPRADAPDFLEAVLKVAAKFHVRALLHGCEPEMFVYSRERSRIEAEGIFLPLNPRSVIELCRDKIALGGFLGENGFMPLRHWCIGCPDDLRPIDVFPVVVKPFTGSGGSKDCFIAQDVQQLSNIMGYLRWEGSVMAQEYVGTPEAEFTVGVLVDMDGTLINSIAVRRHLDGGLNVRMRVPNRTGRKELGPMLVVSSGVSHGEVGRFPEVTGVCEAVAAALGARGPLNVQCRVDHAGNVRVFEINPRFSGTTSIRALMGYNEPDILIRSHVLGQRPEPGFAYRTGTVMRSLEETIVNASQAKSWEDVVSQ